jgi:hypothetical protein
MVSLPASDFKAGKANHIWRVKARIIASDEPAMLVGNQCAVVYLIHLHQAGFCQTVLNDYF